MRVVSQVGPQSPFVQPTQRDRVGDHLPVQGAETHQVDGGLKDKNRVISLIAAKAERSILVAAWNIALEAMAILIVGTTLVGEYRHSSPIPANKDAVVVLGVLI